MSCVLTNPFIFKFIITFCFSFVFTKWLYALYKSTMYIIFATLNLSFNYFGFKFTVAVHKGLFIKRPFFYVLCILYIPI